MGKTGDSKGGRVNYSSSDKEIFMDIMKNADGGKLFNVVMSGTTTNDMKHRIWQRVSELFKNNTGIDASTEQCRRLFTRMKADEKQKHDLEINKRFMGQCSKTGGGPSPDIPGEIDGDDIDTTPKFDFLDPVDTPWNVLSTAEQKSGHGEQVMEQELDVPKDLLESGQGQVLELVLENFKAPAKLPIVAAPSLQGCSGAGGPRYRFPGSSEIRMPRPKFMPHGSPSPTFSHGTPSPSSSYTPERRREKVEIVMEDGTRQMLDVEESNSRNKGKVVKTSAKQEELDPAKKYWTEMLAFQKTNMQWQKQLLQEKIKTEKLKQYVLKKKGKVESAVSDEESDVGEGEGDM